jgi:Putative MetA-pathway of phenol degradation
MKRRTGAIAWSVLAVCCLVSCAVPAAHAQDNYEIQVYGSETVAPENTMVELHSNYTIEGRKQVVDGVEPTNHALHETIEITQGLTPWSEVGLYIFTSSRSGQGVQWVGDHIRPRVRAPESWHLPVGLSMSAEFGYQRAAYSEDTWTLELRPIIDKQIGRWYYSVNPTFDRSFHGASEKTGFVFSPNVKVSYDFTKKITGGLEYYGSLGPLGDFDAVHDQQQQFFPAIDLNLSPKWEINFGVGIGPTAGTDRLIFKTIVGRRFSWGHSPKESAASWKAPPPK